MIYLYFGFWPFDGNQIWSLELRDLGAADIQIHQKSLKTVEFFLIKNLNFGIAGKIRGWANSIVFEDSCRGLNLFI